MNLTEGRRWKRNFPPIVFVKCTCGKVGHPWTKRRRFQFRCSCGLLHDVVVN